MLQGSELGDWHPMSTISLTLSIFEAAKATLLIVSALAKTILGREMFIAWTSSPVRKEVGVYNCLQKVDQTQIKKQSRTLSVTFYVCRVVRSTWCTNVECSQHRDAEIKIIFTWDTYNITRTNTKLTHMLSNKDTFRQNLGKCLRLSCYNINLLKIKINIQNTKECEQKLLACNHTIVIYLPERQHFLSSVDDWTNTAPMKCLEVGVLVLHV